MPAKKSNGYKKKPTQADIKKLSRLYWKYQDSRKEFQEKYGASNSYVNGILIDLR